MTHRSLHGLHRSHDVSTLLHVDRNEVDRNPKAVSAKQPAFVISETGTTSGGKSLGHLFIGTILTSPVLYLRLHKSLRSRAADHPLLQSGTPRSVDHHLTIMNRLLDNLKHPLAETKDLASPDLDWPQVFDTQAIRLRPMTLFNPVFNCQTP